MITALIFAGGTGQRMNSRSKPKQFLEVYGKPIIIYTLEHFEYHDEVDNIVLVCLESWINEMRGLINRYGITKVKEIVPGGDTGHDSIFNGLKAMKANSRNNDIVLIHDGVRPLITEELISNNINAVKKYGNAITVEGARESVIQSVNGQNIDCVTERNCTYIAKAPQSFYYNEIFKVYEMSMMGGVKSIDSAHLLSYYDIPMHMVQSTKNNMKITDPADYYVFKALYEVIENQQIFGI
ncbi:MAG: 2-C-methyl-D-erythritol 4-phosphate cytidylyltransferase [Clostridiales bacterium]|nr:2-C-methyl-D-erythritol 4-phosphate cytidylyltransferase [Clostridiales bacterium]